MVTIRSICRSSAGSHKWREPSWCSIIPTIGRRGRFLRCAERLTAERLRPAAVSTLFVQP
jgi:hypothetical protein